VWGEEGGEEGWGGARGCGGGSGEGGGRQGGGGWGRTGPEGTNRGVEKSFSLNKRLERIHQREQRNRQHRY